MENVPDNVVQDVEIVVLLTALLIVVHHVLVLVMVLLFMPYNIYYGYISYEIYP